MSQGFIRSVTVLPNGKVDVKRQTTTVGKNFPLTEIGEGTRVHVVGTLNGLVLGFYAGNQDQREFVGKAVQRGLERDTTEAVFIISFRGVGELQFFANLSVSDLDSDENANGQDIDLAANCGLSKITDLSVDKDLGRIYVGGNTVEAGISVLVEVDPTNALPKQVYKVGEPGRSIEWSAAREGAIAVVLDDGTVKVLTPGHERFRNLPDGKDLRAQKVFSGSRGFFFREVSRDVSSLEVDRDGIELGDSTNILDPIEDLLCVTQGADGKDLLVVTSNEGYAFVATPI